MQPFYKVLFLFFVHILFITATIGCWLQAPVVMIVDRYSLSIRLLIIVCRFRLLVVSCRVIAMAIVVIVTDCRCHVLLGIGF